MDSDFIVVTTKVLSVCGGARKAQSIAKNSTQLNCDFQLSWVRVFCGVLGLTRLSSRGAYYL